MHNAGKYLKYIAKH